MGALPPGAQPGGRGGNAAAAARVDAAADGVGTRIFGGELLICTLYILGAWHAGDPCTYDPLTGAGMLGLLGDREAGFRCLGEAVEGGYVVFLKVDPLFDPYREAPRLDALLARVGLND